MNIGQAAQRSGLPPKTIRYYEDIGLLKPARRANGFRDYADRDVHELRFIGRSRNLGFTVEECRHLLELYRDKDRASAEVRDLASTHIQAIHAKIEELQAMERTLIHLVEQCAGNDRPDCPILENLSGLEGGSDSGRLAGDRGGITGPRTPTDRPRSAAPVRSAAR